MVIKKWKTAKNSIIPLILLGGGIFLFVLAFYTHFHPLYIFDTDDWANITTNRVPWPTLSAWNPTKLLPEIFMPLIATLGVWLFMPFNNDYIGSMCLAFASFLGIILVFYFISLYAILRKSLKNAAIPAFLVTICLVILHFLPMGNAKTANYMLYSNNVTCIFHYTIPALWNSILVMYAIRNQDKLVSLKANKLLVGIVIFWIYFD